MALDVFKYEWGRLMSKRLPYSTRAPNLSPQEFVLDA